MTTRRPFDYRAFRDGWRALAADHGIDPRTGQYAYADDARWWAKDPLMWTDAGPAHSSVEQAAFASIAAQARAAAHTPTANVTHLSNAVDYSDQRMYEVINNPTALHDLPLREMHWHEGIGDYSPHDLSLALLHEMRGVEVVEIEGLRMEVLRRSNSEARPKKRSAA
jgi:hypothetical protein